MSFVTSHLCWSSRNCCCLWQQAICWSLYSALKRFHVSTATKGEQNYDSTFARIPPRGSATGKTFCNFCRVWKHFLLIKMIAKKREKFMPKIIESKYVLRLKIFLPGPWLGMRKKKENFLVCSCKCQIERFSAPFSSLKVFHISVSVISLLCFFSPLFFFKGARFPNKTWNKSKKRGEEEKVRGMNPFRSWNLFLAD